MSSPRHAETVMVRGDSYCVPAETKYTLEILEEATVVEATCPSDRGANTFDE